jgi:ubiquitin-like domain-containing CTD phosphatase 1
VTELKNLEKEMLEKAPEILDDFESDVLDSEPLLCYADPVYVARLAARVEKYKGLSPLNETREGKKLLVLDIDYTLFDHRTPGENAQELARPYLHVFCRARIRGTTSSSGARRACCGLKRKCKN